MIRLLRYVIHHDKNGRLDPNAEERLKSISIAYQTLSDPQLRHKYNEFGPKESAPEGGFVDPEEVFGLILGGQRFLPLIGPLFFRDSFSRHMKTAFQGADATEGDDVATPFQRDARDSQRGAKVRLHRGRDPVAIDRPALCRPESKSLRRGMPPACRSSLRICVTSSAVSQRMPLAQPTPT